MSKDKRQLVVLTILFGMLFMYASSISAQSPIFYLWGDEEKVRCDVYPVGPYIAFNVYVFLIPGADGAFAAEYKLTGLPGHFMIAHEPGPLASGATLGNPFGPPGFSVSFIMCLTEPTWVWKVECMAPDMDPGYYTLEPHDETGFFGVALCSGDRPLVDGWLYGQFGYNSDGWCRFGTEESSWGAIKALYQ